MANWNFSGDYWKSKSILIVVFVLVLSWTCSGRIVRRTRNNKHHTKIACEGETLNLTCPTGYVINIVRANYGRFSLLVCNDRGETWSDVQCMYPKSTRIMEERCGNRTECEVQATSHVFSDLCPGVEKYLQVEFRCVLYLKSDSNTVVYTLFTDSQPAPTRPTLVPEAPANDWSVTDGSPTQKIELITSKPSLCPEIERRGLKWPSTRVNNAAKVPCPNNDDAYAEWWCSFEGNWTLENPDLSRCVSPWARQLEIQSKSIDNEEAVKTLARNLQADTRSNRLYGGDMSASVEVMQQLANTANDLTPFGDSDLGKTDFLFELNKYLVETGSNLLQDEQQGAWFDLPPSNQSATADRFMSAVEDMAVSISRRLDQSKPTVPISSPKITVEISNVQIQDYVQFPAQSLVEYRLDNIQLPRAALERSGSESQWSKVVFISYDSILGDYMRPESVPVSDENGVETKVERRVVSKLISASVVKVGRDGDGSSVLQGRRRDVANVDRLAKPVLMTFVLKKPEENMTNAACIYWRKSERRWSTDGCVVEKQNDTHVSCSCDHLTTFAVLMDVRGIRLDVQHQLALSFITCIGCIISICSCAIAIVAFCFFSGPHPTDRTTIHTNLCFCLLVAETVFLFGIAQTQHPLACSIVAGVLHYWFLAAFAWMLLEGFQLYSLLIEVFVSERNRTPYFYVFGYGMPAVIVGISVLIDYSGYGTRRHCWLNTENYFVLSFVGPVAVVLVANTVFLLMAFYVMCHHMTYSAGRRHDANRSTVENIGVWLRGATILVILLGLTWAFGLLYINDSTVYMAYAFTILNSLQGCFIFIFHVLLNDKMRREWSKWLLRRQVGSSAWIRSPSSSADYKPAKAHLEEPMPKLVSVVRTLEGESPNASGTETTSLLTKLFGGQRQKNSVRGSVGQLLMRTGSMNSAKMCKYEYPYATHSSVSDVPTNSELMVENPCPRYSVSPRPPPNFPPPSPPKQMYTYSRHVAATSAMPAFHAVLQDRHYAPNLFERSFIDDPKGGDDDQGNPYASTDAYFQADSDRPDSGYSGSAHHPTPPPAVCLDGGWPTPSLRRVQHADFCHPSKRKIQSTCEGCRTNMNMQYEVPVHATIGSPAYGARDV